jgi:hypothetical protein
LYSLIARRTSFNCCLSGACLTICCKLTAWLKFFQTRVPCNAVVVLPLLFRYGVEEGQNFDKTWGGLPVVIFCGDDVQLPPQAISSYYDPKPLHG